MGGSNSPSRKAAEIGGNITSPFGLGVGCQDRDFLLKPWNSWQELTPDVSNHSRLFRRRGTSIEGELGLCWTFPCTFSCELLRVGFCYGVTIWSFNNITEYNILYSTVGLNTPLGMICVCGLNTPRSVDIHLDRSTGRSTGTPDPWGLSKWPKRAESDLGTRGDSDHSKSPGVWSVWWCVSTQLTWSRTEPFYSEGISYSPGGTYLKHEVVLLYAGNRDCFLSVQHSYHGKTFKPFESITSSSRNYIDVYG